MMYPNANVNKQFSSLPVGWWALCGCPSRQCRACIAGVYWCVFCLSYGSTMVPQNCSQKWCCGERLASTMCDTRRSPHTWRGSALRWVYVWCWPKECWEPCFGGGGGGGGYSPWWETYLCPNYIRNVLTQLFNSPLRRSQPVLKNAHDHHQEHSTLTTAEELKAD